MDRVFLSREHDRYVVGRDSPGPGMYTNRPATVGKIQVRRAEVLFIV